MADNNMFSPLSLITIVGHSILFKMVVQNNKKIDMLYVWKTETIHG